VRLSELHPDEAWPVVSSISELLRREGLVEARRRWRRMLLNERPLAHAGAACFYQPSPRPYDFRERKPAYTAEQAVRRVRSNSEIKWPGSLVFVGEALVGEPVGVNETDEGAWAVHYFDVLLGFLGKGVPANCAAPGEGMPRPRQISVTWVSGPKCHLTFSCSRARWARSSDCLTRRGRKLSSRDSQRLHRLPTQSIHDNTNVSPNNFKNTFDK
jgi:hypothetical protein